MFFIVLLKFTKGHFSAKHTGGVRYNPCYLPFLSEDALFCSKFY